MRFNNIDIKSETSRELTETIRKESAHIIDMYFRLIKYFENDHCRKLNISCNDTVRYPRIVTSRNGYISLQIPFCPSELLSLSGNEKSHFYLNIIHKSVRYVGRKWGWNLQYFDFIRRTIISNNFKNQWAYGKPSRCPEQNRSAVLRITQTIKETAVLLIITENQTVTDKIPVATTAPTFQHYRQYLGDIRWTDGRHLEIIDKGGQIIFASVLR